ncbi:MAG: L,D-transpeptidase [Pseudomonadota bacterium]
MPISFARSCALFGAALTSSALLLTAQAMTSTAHASQRYATPPPLTVGSDLASPWTLQLAPRSRATREARRRALAQQQRRVKRQRQVHRQKRIARSTAPTARTGVATASLRRSQPMITHSTGGMDPALLPTRVAWNGSEKPGTIVVDTIQRRLFLIGHDGMARRYAVGVGKPGFEWAGTHRVSRKAEWPSWTPPKEMIARVKRESGRVLPDFMPGGIDNPMGARALYLGSSIYRIHGTNQAWSIGKAVSSGCIRMRNEDVMDLYERVPVGAKVKVL